jgi:hypothetical protein
MTTTDTTRQGLPYAGIDYPKGTRVVDLGTGRSGTIVAVSGRGYYMVETGWGDRIQAHHSGLVADGIAGAVEALIDPDQGVCPEGHACTLGNGPRGPIRLCGEVHRPEFQIYAGMPLIAYEVTAADIDLAAIAGADADLIAWARDTLAAREDSQTSTPEADRLMAEAEVLSSTIALSLADGELPRGLYGNEARLARVVLALQTAVEIFGLEVDPTPVPVDAIDGKDLGWIVSAGEVPTDRVADVRRAVNAALDLAAADLKAQGIAVYADRTR